MLELAAIAAVVAMALVVSGAEVRERLSEEGRLAVSAVSPKSTKS